MPRNGSGTMSVTNSFSPATTISSSAVNANFSDIATEVTNSLPRDGQASMTGQLKAATGTGAAPGITFGSDTDSGFFRKSANVIGVSVGGTEVGTFTSASGGGVVDAFPSGTTMLFVQTAAPTGWTKSTSHDDKALRVVSGTASSGGTTAFSSVLTSRTILEANLPEHTHTGSGTTANNNVGHTHTWSGTTSTDPGHTHSDSTVSFTSGANPGGGNNTVTGTTSTTTGSGGSHNHTVSGTTSGVSANHTHTFSFTSDSTGSGTAMDFAVQYVDTIIAVKD